MPYEDKEIQRGSDNQLYQFDATGNSGKGQWNLHTSTPSGKDKELVKKDPNESNAGITGSLASEGARGVYHGLIGSDFVPGTLGLPGALGNDVYNWWTDSNKSPLPGPADIKNRIKQGEKAILGQPIPEPTTPFGNATRTAAAFAPMMAMPAAGATAGAGAGIVRGLGSDLARRFAGNVAAPTALSEAAGYAFDDNPTAKFVAALLAGRGANPFGGGRNLATRTAFRENGVPGASLFNAAGDKTVLPGRLRELGRDYDVLEARNGLPRGGLRDAFNNGVLSPTDARSYLNTRRQFGVVSDLNELARKQSEGQFTPRQIRDTIVDTTSPAHNTASKLAKRSTEGNVAIPAIGALLGTLAGAGGMTAVGQPALGHYAGIGGGMGGAYLGQKLSNMTLPLLNAKRLEAILGNDPARSAGAWATYSAPARSQNKDQ